MKARSRERAVPSFDDDKRCSTHREPELGSYCWPMQQRLCVCVYDKGEKKRTLYGTRYESGTIPKWNLAARDYNSGQQGNYFSQKSVVKI